MHRSLIVLAMTGVAGNAASTALADEPGRAAAYRHRAHQFPPRDHAHSAALIDQAISIYAFGAPIMIITVIRACIVALAVVMLSAAPARAETQPLRPHIVHIVADDL